MALTATEKRIAQFILDDVSAAVELPIAELARLTQTSQASVTRFARALGCKDVRELKVKLAQSLAIGQRFILDVPDLDGVQGIYESIISVLETHRRSLDMNAISLAVSWLSQARQILALGTGGGSTICSQEIQYRLFRLGLPVVSQNDSLMMRMMCSAVMPQDVVIVLSLGAIRQKSSKVPLSPVSTARELSPLRLHKHHWQNRWIWYCRCWFRKVITFLSPPLPVTPCSR